MKQAIYFRFAVALLTLFSAACSGSSRSRPVINATPAPTRVESAVVSTAPASTSSAPSPTITLFTEAGGDYLINVTPADFVDKVNNPYFPLPAGAKWEYEIREGDGSKQKDTLEVLKETRDVNGVQATVVRDTVSAGGKIVEDTLDWFAQDKYGNVWYVGEAVDNYVGGVLASHGGSWEWGVDGALPGIIMWADPSAHLNEDYRQEYYIGKAEDMGRVLSVDESLSMTSGSFTQVVKTLDFSKLETNAQEQKFYAPGIGLIQELDLNSKEEMVLIHTTFPGK